MTLSQSYRGIILAFQFLTRMPTPQISDFDPADLTRSSTWFPLVGLVVGFILAVMLTYLGAVDEWAAAALVLVIWIWITGGLHLDGLSDLTDAMGAAHRNPDRFHEVLKDPHVGAFGVMAIGLQLTVKIIFLMLLTKHDAVWALALVCAWGRLGPLVWSRWLPVLRPTTGGEGTGERFAWEIRTRTIIIWAVILLIPALFQPLLALLALPVFIWWLFLKYRLGGQTGDCLGAGVEISESVGMMFFTLLLLHGMG